MGEDSSSTNPTDVIAFAAISLVLGIACRHLLRGTRVPYSVAILIIGFTIGFLGQNGTSQQVESSGKGTLMVQITQGLKAVTEVMLISEYGTSYNLGRFGNGIHLWVNIDPDLLLAIFLPPLLFESSFSMEVHQVKRCMVQMILLAGPGVVISTFCLGSALKFTFPYDWNWRTSLLLGGLLSATDPVAVVSLLKDLGASKKLSTIIEGESLMNDGVAIVAYQLFYRMIVGENFSFGSTVKFLTQVTLGGVCIGAAFGIMSAWWLYVIFSDTVIDITLTLAVSYLAYFTSQEVADVSGVLAVMTLGVFYALVARIAYKSGSRQKFRHFWELVAYTANTLVFILSGVIIADGIYSSSYVLGNHGNSWGYLILLYVFVQVSRIFVVGLLYPFLHYIGYGLSWKEAIILIWSGLRGVVALSLALSVRVHSSNSSVYLRAETGILFLFFTSGIVFLTLIINGSTTQLLLYLLSMDRLPSSSKQILDNTKHKMQRKAVEFFCDLRDDQVLGPVDWSTVERYLPCLQNVDPEVAPSHSISCSDNNLECMNLTDVRIRLLNGVQAAYLAMLDEGRIRAATANLLMQSVDEALDLVSDLPLCDWRGLSSNVKFPSYYNFLQRSIFSEKLAKYVVVDWLESTCYICAAFLSAHRIACKKLHDFIGECEIVSIVVNESKAQEEEARIFLEDVRVAFPQLLCGVKTRQVTYSVLKQLCEYLEDLKKFGLLEDEEISRIHYSVQADIKKLESNPSLVKIPKKCDVIRSHHLFEAFPPTFQKVVERSTRSSIEPSGRTLYKEGSNPEGFWLVSNGTVKWSCESSKSNSCLHPVITQGDTLGLYEVLCEKPYICDMITDSVVLCFFVKVDRKMVSQLRSNPRIEELLWKESVIVVAKVLFPQIFETRAMFDLRTLNSTMTTHINEESVEIGHHSIGFLVEGCIRSQGGEMELLTSPALLYPSNANQIFQNASGSRYQAYSRSRIIVFDWSAPEAENVSASCSVD